MKFCCTFRFVKSALFVLANILVLRSLRTKKSKEEDVNLTQADIAYDAGISVRYYNKLENAKTIPTIDTLMKIAGTYKMSLSDICKQIEEY